MKIDKLGLEYKFSKNENTSSSYALCFAKFIEYLICKKINVSHEKLHKKIIYNLYKEKKLIKVLPGSVLIKILCNYYAFH